VRGLRVFERHSKASEAAVALMQAVDPATATSASGLGLTPPHLHRDWANPAHPHPDLGSPRHIRTGTGLTPATSAPGLSAIWALFSWHGASRRSLRTRSHPDGSTLRSLLVRLLHVSCCMLHAA
jgi:hypothetical protein